ncbi:hypothetical protein PQX77_011865 [Marasmius sp. AFHP31]|nr:hypothetical protein PQX77_011865 [Marasmius sp. AFHP31]
MVHFGTGGMRTSGADLGHERQDDLAGWGHAVSTLSEFATYSPAGLGVSKRSASKFMWPFRCLDHLFIARNGWPNSCHKTKELHSGPIVLRFWIPPESIKTPGRVGSVSSVAQLSLTPKQRTFSIFSSQPQVMVLTFVQRFISPRLLRPMRYVLGLSRPIQKPAAKLVRKAASIHASAKPRRKRLHPRGEKTIIKAKRPRKKLLPKGSHEALLTMSVSDFERAAERMFSRLPGSALSEADMAFLNKLGKAAFKHDMLVGVKRIEKEIQMTNIRIGMVRLPIGPRPRLPEHEIIARQLGDEDEKRTSLARKITREVEETKAYWDKLVDAAWAGEESPDEVLASDEEYAMWIKYQMKWDDLEAGVSVDSRFDYDEIPWPTLKRDVDLMVEQYEEFVLSPKRPGYRTVRWRERLAEERRLWDVKHVKAKVVPFVMEEIREEMVQTAEILCEYLDELVGKYAGY